MADKKNGRLTGRFRVQVMRGSRRLSGRANSMKEAEALEQELLERLENSDFLSVVGPKAPPKPMTLWEARNKVGGLLWAGQDTEVTSYRKLERIIEIAGRDKALDAYDLHDIDKLVRHLGNEGVKDATINRYLACISAFLKFCYRRKYRTTPVPDMDWRKESEHRIRWLSYEEEAEMMQLLKAPFDDLVYVAIRTGLRASELLDLEADQIEGGWVHLWNTKCDAPRSVPITQEIHDLLHKHTAQGLPTYWQLRDEWDRVRTLMGNQDDEMFVFHCCRHTYATRAIQAGVNVRVLQKLLGHKTIQTTLRYAHVDDRTLADAAHAALAFHEGRCNGGADKVQEGIKTTEDAVETAEIRDFGRFDRT